MTIKTEGELMPRSKKFTDFLLERLKDPKEAMLYFNAILEECKDCDEQEAKELVLTALKDIAEAQGGIADLAVKTKLGRQSLYKTLSPKGNPKLSTLITITNTLFSAPLYKK
jgi:probable addiction module antidote protein